MKKKNLLKLLLILILIIFTWFIYSNYFKKNITLIPKTTSTTETTSTSKRTSTSKTTSTSETIKDTTDINEEAVYNSNIIKDLNYTSRDLRGNEYSLNAKEGEIDLDNSDIIFLTDVTANIKLAENSELILITSDYGKYNTINYDTIFSKNVKIDYIDNIITGDYLDFSMLNNLLIISRNVVYKNLENTMKADVLEFDTKTKNTKIYMYDSKKQVVINNLK
jgi:uncharacterized protein YcbK (DUF882 family)